MKKLWKGLVGKLAGKVREVLGTLLPPMPDRALAPIPVRRPRHGRIYIQY